MGSWRTAGPAGHAQQAGSSVMAGRKLFNRTQNPSRMGPNTTRSFSDVPSNTPGKIFAASSSFRPGLANGHSSKFTFSPRVPHNTMRESFPTVTPGRSFRGASADMTGRGMSNTNATNLFQMRIASPPPELDGEELAKQVPENPNRIGSIYADEFLSHLVPTELDDLQRRQFLCILDLRRLKYAANEIFAKKDWRVNIMNFAKEYEKSRSLIMLRYGLYEFKTVPASREVLKKWKQENNVPDEDEEMEDDSTPKSNGTVNTFRSSVKRRAEDDLSKDTSSKSLSAAQNKRRLTDREPLAETAAPTSNAGATPMAKKTKRGSEQMDQDGENQPHKAQKSKPSATLSLFEEVANHTPAKRAASPPKPVSKSLFGDSTASKPQSSLFAKPSTQPAVGGSTKATSLGGNIFGHLSEQNTPLGSDDEERDDDGEDGSDDEVEEVSASKAPSSAAPVFGASTPSLFGSKPTNLPGDSSSSLFGAKPIAPTSAQQSSGSLFGNGASLMDRASTASGSQNEQPSEKRPASPPKSIQPQDKTWNPNTPIKFGAGPAQTSTPMFGSNAQPSSLFSKPGEAPKLAFGGTETPKPAQAPSFGSQAKDFANETPTAAAPSLFGQTSKPSEPSSNLFGNSTSLFGKPNEQKTSEPAAPSTPSLFGSKSQGLDSTTPFGKPAGAPAAQTQSKSLFGGLNSSGANVQSSGPSLFGTKDDKPAGTLFGTANGVKPAATSTLFGANSTAEEKKEDSVAKRKKADSDGAEGETSSKKYTFGGNAPTPAAKLPPKTDAAAKGATDAASVFGAPSVGEKKYTFGAPAAPPASDPTPAPTSLFGNANAAASQPEPIKTQPSIFASTPAPAAPSTGFTFGAQPSTTPANPPPNSLFGNASSNNVNANQGSGFSFGSNAPAAPSGGGSFTFNAGGGEGSFNNPFASGGNPSQPPSFDFGASTSQFQFGGSSTPAAPASSFTFGGASQPAQDASAPSNNMLGGAASNGGSSMFSFGGASQPAPQPAGSGLFSGQPANAAQGIFASQLAVPPAGSSTGTSKY